MKIFKPWTREEEIALIRMRLEKCTYKDIAQHFGRSCNQVIGKWHRMNGGCGYIKLTNEQKKKNKEDRKARKEEREKIKFEESARAKAAALAAMEKTVREKSSSLDWKEELLSHCKTAFERTEIRLSDRCRHPGCQHMSFGKYCYAHAYAARKVAA